MDDRPPRRDAADDDHGPDVDPESSIELLERARAGDRGAFDELIRRYLPALRSWASGRLPPDARNLLDTDDLVQDTLMRSVQGIERFEHRREGALLAYLRQAVVNRVRDEVRRLARHPGRSELVDDLPARGPSPLEEAVGREGMERYEAALAALRDTEREAVIARLEMGLSYDEVARAVGSPSANAARMMVSRALLRVAERMSDGDP